MERELRTAAAVLPLIPIPSFSNYQPRLTGPLLIEEELEPFLRDSRERGRALPSFVVEAFR